MKGSNTLSSAVEILRKKGWNSRQIDKGQVARRKLRNTPYEEGVMLAREAGEEFKKELAKIK